MFPLKGKGLWLWQLEACGDTGDPWPLFSRIASAHLSHVVVKVSEGVGGYNNPTSLHRLTDACHLEGLETWGFDYTYGRSPSNAALEGAELGKALVEYGMDGAVVDAEGQWETPAAGEWVAPFYDALRSVFAGPVALSSYWAPSFHGEFPWAEWFNRVDLFMPQVYPGATRDAALTLRQSHEEYLKLAVNHPRLQFFPIGAISAEEGGNNPAKVVNFCREVDVEGLRGANMWDFQEEVPEMWEAFIGWVPKSIV